MLIVEGDHPPSSPGRSVSFWESRQAMRASEELSDRTRSDTAEATTDTIEDVERYEVGLFEMSG
jgi:hypothetical protein